MCGYKINGSTTAIFSATILISYSTNTNQTIIVATCYPLTNPSKWFPYIYTHSLSLSLIVIDDWDSLPTPCESFSCLLLLLSRDHCFIYYHSSNKIFQYKKNKERNIFYLVNGDRSMFLLPVPLQWWW